MSEMEDLKKSAEHQKAVQTMQGVSDYLDRLTAAIDTARRAHSFSTALWFVAWLGWVASGFSGIEIEYIFLMVYLFALIYDQYRFREMTNAFREFRGAIEILKLLGYVNLPDRGDRQKRKIFEEGVSMVKRWFTQKKEAQEKVYAPA